MTLENKKNIIKSANSAKRLTFFIWLFLTIGLGLIYSVALKELTSLLSFLSDEYVRLGVGFGLGFLTAFFVCLYLRKIANCLKGLSDDEVNDNTSDSTEVVKDTKTKINDFPSMQNVRKTPASVQAKALNTTTSNEKPTLSCLEFRFTDRNTAIETSINTFSLQKIVIPQIHNGFPVRVIKSAISDPDETGITEQIVLPKTIKTIYSYAFANQENLKSIVLPDGITKIGDHAFLNCRNLSEIFIPLSVTEIGQAAFKGCPKLIIKVATEFKPAGWDFQYKDDNVSVIYNQAR